MGWGDLGRAGTVGTEPGVGKPPRARAPAGPKRWLLTEPRAFHSNARGGWWQGERNQARSKLPGHARGFLSRRGGKPGLAVPRGRKLRCQAVNTPGAVPAQPRASGSCGTPQRLEEAHGEGKNTEARLEIAHHLPQPEGESCCDSEGVLSDPETGQGLTLRSRRTTSIAPRLCKSPNPGESDAAVHADVGGRNR